MLNLGAVQFPALKPINESEAKKLTWFVRSEHAPTVGVFLVE
jgi:hypothetical protein